MRLRTAFIFIVLILAVGAAAPHAAHATVLQFNGAETGDGGDIDGASVTISSSVFKHGAYSFHLNPTGTNVAHVDLRPPDTAGNILVNGSATFGNNVYISAWVRVDTLPTVGGEQLIRGVNTSNASTFTLRSKGRGWHSTVIPVTKAESDTRWQTR